MRNNGNKICALVLAGVLVFGGVCSIKAAVVASEEQVEGANVLLEQYCSNVANGSVQPQTSEVLASVEVTPAPSATP